MPYVFAISMAALVILFFVAAEQQRRHARVFGPGEPEGAILECIAWLTYAAGIVAAIGFFLALHPLTAL